MNQLSEDLIRYIITFLCQYCNKLKYLNKKYNQQFGNKYLERFLAIKNNYNLIFNTILNTNYYNKCFNCYYLSFKSIEYLSMQEELIKKYEHTKNDKNKQDSNLDFYDKILSLDSYDETSNLDCHYRIRNFSIHVHEIEEPNNKKIINNLYKILITSKNVIKVTYCCNKKGLMYKLKINISTFI